MADASSFVRQQDMVDLLDKFSRKLTRSVGPGSMHPGQWSALRFVRNGRGHATVGDFASSQGVTHAPASRALAALERKGLITIKIDAEDHRVRRVAVTREGEKLLSEDPIEALRRALDKLSTRERGELRHHVTLLNNELREAPRG